ERVETRETLERALGKGSWDLVLCDNSMPSLTGREALAIVNETRSGIPFIFLSGVKPRQGKAAEPMIGVSGYLEKGESQELHAVVRQALSGGALEGLPQTIQSGTVSRRGMPAARPRILIVDDQEENLVAL